MVYDPSLDDTYKDPVIGRISFAGKDVLEVGCGTGGFTLEHLTQANSILGIDPDAEAVDLLRAQWPGSLHDSSVDFRAEDIRNFLLPESAFDIAVFWHSF